MTGMIIQYVLIVVLVIALGYLVYLLKDKNVDIKDDYFGLAYILLSSLESSETANENIKNILRVVSNAARYVEINYKDDDNEFKEEEAFKIVKETINTMNFKSKITDEKIKNLIRIAAAMLPGKNEN